MNLIGQKEGCADGGGGVLNLVVVFLSRPQEF
jgi:xanthine dehydrogenase iron-sulfur cluster and FAD-binding subunit A